MVFQEEIDTVLIDTPGIYLVEDSQDIEIEVINTIIPEVEDIIVTLTIVLEADIEQEETEDLQRKN